MKGTKFTYQEDPHAGNDTLLLRRLARQGRMPTEAGCKIRHESWCGNDARPCSCQCWLEAPDGRTIE